MEPVDPVRRFWAEHVWHVPVYSPQLSDEGGIVAVESGAVRAFTSFGCAAHSVMCMPAWLRAVLRPDATVIRRVEPGRGEVAAYTFAQVIDYAR